MILFFQLAADYKVFQAIGKNDIHFVDSIDNQSFFLLPECLANDVEYQLIF